MKRKQMRLMSWVLSLALLLSAIPMQIYPVSAASTTDFAGGDGTEANPYLIATKTHLNNVRNYLDAHFKMTADIVFVVTDFIEGGEFYNNGNGWEPIGDEFSPFTGTFDGEDHSIDGLYIHLYVPVGQIHSGEDGGLFGYNNGFIKNLEMRDLDFQGEQGLGAGGITAYNDGEIYNCHIISGSIDINGYVSGGIAKENHGEISYCSNAATLEDKYVGGIVGFNYSTVYGCYNLGDIADTVSSGMSGGIVAQNYGSSAIVNSCYNKGRIGICNIVSDITRVSGGINGGIAGDNSGTIFCSYNVGRVTSFDYGDFVSGCGGIVGSNEGVIENCYNIGSAYYSAPETVASYAGIAGYLSDNSILANCYYLDTTLHANLTYPYANAVKCSAEQMRLPGTFCGFDFDTIWEFDNAGSYPFPTLRGVPHKSDDLEENSTDFAGGTGTPYDPFLVANKTHLNNVRNHLGSCFKMIADIEFTKADFAEGGEFYNNGRGWEPIGVDFISSFISHFHGSFDGDKHIIKGLYINIEKSEEFQAAGLFGVNEGIVKNLKIVNGTIDATGTRFSLGGITGDNGGTISNCSNTDSLTTIKNATAFWTGGIAGVNRGEIDYCRSGNYINVENGDDGEISGIAGCGDGMSTSIISSYNIGNINFMGGYNSIIGGISSSNEIVENCYNTGSIVVTDMEGYYNSVGGISGFGGTIKDCFNAGALTVTNGSSTQVGGIAGDSSKISECYNIGDIKANDGNKIYVGGIAGQTEERIDSCYYLNNVSQGVGVGVDTAVKCDYTSMVKSTTFAGFDFDTVWTMAGNEDYPYPELRKVPMQFEKILQSISISQKPNKLAYIEGETFTTAGMMVTANYSGGISEIVTGYTISGYTSTPGTKTITVSYGDQTATFTVEVVAAHVPARPGDINGDGLVNTTDARLALQFAVGKIALTEEQLLAGDVNGDGAVNTTDARLILQFAVGKITEDDWKLSEKSAADEDSDEQAISFEEVPSCWVSPAIFFQKVNQPVVEH